MPPLAALILLPIFFGINLLARPLEWARWLIAWATSL
jgi:hypothetical protein